MNETIIEKLKDLIEERGGMSYGYSLAEYDSGYHEGYNSGYEEGKRSVLYDIQDIIDQLSVAP